MPYSYEIEALLRMGLSCRITSIHDVLLLTSYPSSPRPPVALRPGFLSIKRMGKLNEPACGPHIRHHLHIRPATPHRRMTTSARAPAERWHPHRRRLPRLGRRQSSSTPHRRRPLGSAVDRVATPSSSTTTLAERRQPSSSTAISAWPPAEPLHPSCPSSSRPPYCRRG